MLNTFEELGFKPEILKAIQEAGYRKPMPIQAKAIPLALEGRDVIGCAQTGTGKTAAFTLPILQRLTKGRGPQVLVLAPTRELALQIGDSVRKYGKYLPFRSTAVYGGMDMEPQIRALRKGVDILIATPGRLLDHIRRGNVSLKTVRYLVLDEADRMLDMGFLPDVEQIIAGMPERQQTMLFSATMPPEIRQLASRYMKEAVRIETAPPSTLAAGITHRIYPVPRGLKSQLLHRLLLDEPVQSVLIFTRTRRGADRVADYLEGKSLAVTRLHSDRTQRQRERALKGFRSGQFKVLVATDIAARGLDIPSVSHVFNYDLPERVEDYVHRAGRTARAEGTGYACCLMAPEEIDLYNALEQHMGREMLAWTSHPEFDYMSEPPEAPARRDRNRNGRGAAPQGGRYHGANGRPARSSKPRRSLAEVAASIPKATPTPPAPQSPFGRRRSRGYRAGM
jgi:ATP-dependent RNA helicase RhlE